MLPYNEIELAPSNSRILALDLGKRRIGLAISDPLGITAQGLPNLERINKRTDFAALEDLIREREVGMILMGNPINMGGAEGRQSGWVREFAAELERRTHLPVKLWDERLTTVEAQRILQDSGVQPRQARQQIDAVAAAVILQSYLNTKKPPRLESDPLEDRYW